MSGPADLWGLPLCKSWMSCFDHQWGLWCSPSRSNFTLSRITAHSTRTVSYRLITLCHIHPDRLFLIPLRMFGQPWTKISLKIIPFTCNHYITVTQGIMARERLWSVDGRSLVRALIFFSSICLNYQASSSLPWNFYFRLRLLGSCIALCEQGYQYQVKLTAFFPPFSSSYHIVESERVKIFWRASVQVMPTVSLVCNCLYT